MGNYQPPAYLRWHIGHAYWLFLETTGELASVLRWSAHKPRVRVKAGREQRDG